jgi:hypothetical protein
VLEEEPPLLLLPPLALALELDPPELLDEPPTALDADELPDELPPCPVEPAVPLLPLLDSLHAPRSRRNASPGPVMRRRFLRNVSMPMQ